MQSINAFLETAPVGLDERARFIMRPESDEICVLRDQQFKYGLDKLSAGWCGRLDDEEQTFDRGPHSYSTSARHFAGA